MGSDGATGDAIPRLSKSEIWTQAGRLAAGRANQSFIFNALQTMTKPKNTGMKLAVQQANGS
jgi:hypothetical protein